jgi:hypothetical protein
VNPKNPVQLTWQVVNRFPLFKEDKYFARIAGIRLRDFNPSGERLWSENGKAADTVDAKGFTKKLRDVLPRTGDTAWQPDTGTYSESSLMRTKNGIVAQSPLTGEHCQWEIKSKDKVETHVSSGSCAYSPKLPVNDISKSYELRLLDASGKVISLTSLVTIKSRLVVALGDSFASGEGNPDHPAIIGSSGKEISEGWMFKPVGQGGFQLKDNNPDNGAHWLDEACHRSLLSWPALAALRRAVLNPHEVVRFASFACSGAEVYDGVLTAQKNPPGAEYSENAIRRRDDDTLELHLSQIAALAKLICRVDGENVFQNKSRKRQAPIWVNGSPSALEGGSQFFTQTWIPKCTEFKYRVDDVLLMIGGNDAAFSSVVTWILEPQDMRWRSFVFGTLRMGKVLNKLVKKRFHPLAPEKITGIHHFHDLYSDVRVALTSLGVSENVTQLALYTNVDSLKSVASSILRRIIRELELKLSPLHFLRRISKSKNLRR